MMWRVSAGLCCLFIMGTGSAKSMDTGFQSFPGLFEPSGIVQLEDGSLLAIEDERSQPMTLLTPTPGPTTSTATPTSVPLLTCDVPFKFSADRLHRHLFQSPGLAGTSDLEGLTVGPRGNLYAITSHSRKKNGKRDSDREKLLRFDVKDGHLTNLVVRRDLRNRLAEVYPEIKLAAKLRGTKNGKGLNIEGLAFNPVGDQLYIALRAPVIEGKAVLLTLLNPMGVFDSNQKIHMAKEPLYLDLNKGGVRDIVYVAKLKGYLIVSQREGTKKKEEAFKLWLWSGDPGNTPRRVRVSGVADLLRIEGISPVQLNGVEKLLMVSDDGNRLSGKAANYLLVDYDRLQID